MDPDQTAPPGSTLFPRDVLNGLIVARYDDETGIHIDWSQSNIHTT